MFSFEDGAGQTPTFTRFHNGLSNPAKFRSALSGGNEISLSSRRLCLRRDPEFRASESASSKGQAHEE